MFVGLDFFFFIIAITSHILS